MKVNCWKYAREVYLVGRSLKFRKFTETEREAVIAFITAMAGTRPAYIPYINLKADNAPASEFVGEGEEKQLVWDKLAKQNDYSLGKMVQKIGRSLKIQFCTEAEKALCDALFEATYNRKGQDYVFGNPDGVNETSLTTEESSTVAEEIENIEGEAGENGLDDEAIG